MRVTKIVALHLAPSSRFRLPSPTGLTAGYLRRLASSVTRFPKRRSLLQPRVNWLLPALGPWYWYQWALILLLPAGLHEASHHHRTSCWEYVGKSRDTGRARTRTSKRKSIMRAGRDAPTRRSPSLSRANKWHDELFGVSEQPFAGQQPGWTWQMILFAIMAITGDSLSEN